MTNNTFVQRVDDEVKKAREHEEWRLEYMTLLMRDNEMREKGRQEGRQEGEERYALLSEKLLEDNRIEELKRSASDCEFRKLLYQEYSI